MALRIDARTRDLDTALAPLLAARGAADQAVGEAVREILAAVRTRGDEALIELTQQFDRFMIDRASIRVEDGALAEARAACGRETLDALAQAAERIRAFHARHVPTDTSYRDEQGVALGEYWTPIASVGLYIPGGTASYPSSVLMNAIPREGGRCVAGWRRWCRTPTARCYLSYWSPPNWPASRRSTASAVPRPWVR